MLNGTRPRVGMVALDASQTNWFDVAQAKSPTVSATKRQTNLPFVPGAVDLPGPRSAGVTILRVESDSTACGNRSRAVGVRTSLGFWRTPVAPTIQPAGTSMLTSKWPKLL